MGVPGELRSDTAEDLELIAQRLRKDNFYQHAADLSTALTAIKSKVSQATGRLREQQQLRLKEGAEDLQRLPEWGELTQEERSEMLGRLDGLAIEAAPDLDGFKRLLAREYDIQTSLSQFKDSIKRQGQERCRQRLKEERDKSGEKGPARLKKEIPLPASLTSAAQLDQLIRQLQEIREQLALYGEIEVTFTRES